MTSFSWLHLSDLHQGMSEQRWLWPQVEEMFFDDLKELHLQCGPWDAVLFSGDLTQRGSAEEFQRLNQVLERLWTHLRSLGSNPALVAVPGNHDLTRPSALSPEVKVLASWRREKVVQDDFWNNSSSRYRQIVIDAFANYAQWWKTHPFPRVEQSQEGLLPGDASFSFVKNGHRFGVVGLNSAFLQLAGGNYEQKLSLGVAQFHAACGGNGVVE